MKSVKNMLKGQFFIFITVIIIMVIFSVGLLNEGYFIEEFSEEEFNGFLNSLNLLEVVNNNSSLQSLKNSVSIDKYYCILSGIIFGVITFLFIEVICIIISIVEKIKNVKRDMNELKYNKLVKNSLNGDEYETLPGYAAGIARVICEGNLFRVSNNFLDDKSSCSIKEEINNKKKKGKKLTEIESKIIELYDNESKEKPKKINEIVEAEDRRIELEYNISEYILYRLRELGFIKKEFTTKEKRFNKFLEDYNQGGIKNKVIAIFNNSIIINYFIRVIIMMFIFYIMAENVFTSNYGNYIFVEGTVLLIIMILFSLSDYKKVKLNKKGKEEKIKILHVVKKLKREENLTEEEENFLKIID